jgi:hypothetical protein
MGTRPMLGCEPGGSDKNQFRQEEMESAQINQTAIRSGFSLDAENEWDTLATALNRYGICHIAPGRRVSGKVPRGEELFYRLMTSTFVRLREATIQLLLTHPDLDVVARSAIERLGDNTRLKAIFYYVATCALQQMWWTRLAADLGPRRPIQPAYIEELGLPSLNADFGQAALLALSNQEEARFGYDAWAGYTSLMDLFLGELIDPRWGKVRARLQESKPSR